MNDEKQFTMTRKTSALNGMWILYACH